MLRTLRSLRRPRALLPGLLHPPGRGVARQRYGFERLLHDGALSKTSALALELGMIGAETDDPKVDARLADAQRRVSYIVDDLRLVGSMLYPPVLAGAGLEDGLRAVAEAAGLRVELDVPSVPLGEEARSRIGLVVADHFHTLPPGSVTSVRVRGRRLVRISITQRRDGATLPRWHWAVLRCE